MITTEDVSVTYLDQPIIGMEGDQFLSAFNSFMLEDDFEEPGRDYADDNQDLSVWVVDDVVESMTIFPRFIDDKPCWSKQLGEQERSI